MKYETSQKEQKIKILEKDKQLSDAKNQRNFWLITGLIILFILFAIIYLLVHNRQKLKNKQKEIETEQKILRLQMNPHFIFNAIFAIQNFIYENNTEKSSLYLSNFAKLMRLILESSRKNLITFEDELQIIEYYIQFQQLRRENSFDYKINISENIDIENTLIPPMLIQPFIENAVEHGFEDNMENALLKINFNLKNNFIFVSIEDNGKGINKTLSSNKKTKHQSLATEITEERLSIILKTKNKENNIKIIDLQKIDKTKKGTIISFKIPFIEEF